MTIFVLRPESRHAFGTLFIEEESADAAVELAESGEYGVEHKGHEFRVVKTMDEYIEEIEDGGSKSEVYYR